jgi:hypothetical protein
VSVHAHLTHVLDGECLHECDDIAHDRDEDDDRQDAAECDTIAEATPRQTQGDVRENVVEVKV